MSFVPLFADARNVLCASDVFNRLNLEKCGLSCRDVLGERSLISCHASCEDPWLDSERVEEHRLLTLCVRMRMM